MRAALLLLALLGCAHAPAGAGLRVRVGEARVAERAPGSVLVPVRIANLDPRRTVRVSTWDLALRGAGAGCALRDPGLVRVEPARSVEVLLRADCAATPAGTLWLDGSVGALVGTSFRTVVVDAAVDVG